MKRLLAQHDLEAMMTSLSPLLPLVSRKSCEAGTTVLAGLLCEALEAEEASSKRTGDLKQLQPKGLMELFTPEKGNGAAAKGQDKGQKEKPQHPPPPPPRPRHEHEQQHGEGAEAVPVSPKNKKAQAPQKRTRKATDKAANKEGLEDEGDEEEEEVKKPKKQGMNGAEKKKQSIKRAQEAWDGVEYPRIVKVAKCVEKEEGGGEGGEEGGGFLCVEVFAKKAGRGHWQEVGFSLDSTQLSSIDELPQKTKVIVTASFQKALIALYGGGSQRWPKVLREALAETTWAKDMLPAVAAAAAGDGGGNEMGVFEGLGDPAAPLFDV
jgi:hypothetical protein